MLVRISFEFFINTPNLAMLAFLSTLYCHSHLQFSYLSPPTDVSKVEIKNQAVHKDYISMLHVLLN